MCSNPGIAPLSHSPRVAPTNFPAFVREILSLESFSAAEHAISTSKLEARWAFKGIVSFLSGGFFSISIWWRCRADCAFLFHLESGSRSAQFAWEFLSGFWD